MATGRQIHSFSFVPNFDPTDSNLLIAQRLLEPLEDKWQRPADHKRISKIGNLYSKSESDQIMVNPVLLGAIPGGDPKITVVGAPTRVAGDMKQELVVIDIENGNSVWVIDGQHRINGMRTSNQPMPFVLLYDERAGHNYTGAYLAELFSIVTTEAKPMKGIHKEWMAYAFSLDKYKSEQKRRLMKILLLLATTTDFGPKHANANPFYGQIQFNDGIEVDGDQIGAFAWTAAKYNESIGKEPIGNLLKKYTNTEIASVISDFVAAFKECHGQSEASSLLFGKNGTGFYKCVGSGLMQAWIHYLDDLQQLPSYKEITDLLKKIGVDQTNWSILTWTRGPGKNDRSGMTTTIRTVFYQLMKEIIEPPKDLHQYLLGRENTFIKLEFSTAINGVLDRKTIHSETIIPFRNENISLDIPNVQGKKRNMVSFHLVRVSDPSQKSHCHSPNCRIRSFRVVNEKGNLLIPPEIR